MPWINREESTPTKHANRCLIETHSKSNGKKQRDGERDRDTDRDRQQEKVRQRQLNPSNGKERDRLATDQQTRLQLNAPMQNDLWCARIDLFARRNKENQGTPSAINLGD